MPPINEVIDYGIEAAESVHLTSLIAQRVVVDAVADALIEEQDEGKGEGKTNLAVKYQDLEFQASSLEAAAKKARENMKQQLLKLKLKDNGKAWGATRTQPPKWRWTSDGVFTVTVGVTIIVYLPKWKNIGKMCEQVRNEWNRVLETIRQHEDGHVKDEKSIWQDAHEKILSKLEGLSPKTKKAEVNKRGGEVLKKLAVESEEARNRYHATFGESPTDLDISIKCP